MELPSNLGDVFFGSIKAVIPLNWQTGWRWKVVEVSTFLGVLSFASWWIYKAFFTSEEEMTRKAKQYEYLRDERGKILSLSYSPLVQATQKARERSQRILKEFEDDDN